jgi:hypothetical protein
MWLLVWLAVGWVPYLLFSDDVGRVVAANPHLVGDPSYFEGVASLDALIRVPLASLSAFVVLLSPGLVAALALNRGRTVEEWLLYAFGASLVMVSVAGAVSLVSTGAGPATFLVSIGAMTAAAFAWLWMRLGSTDRAWPLAARFSHAHLWLAAGVCYALLVVLTPKLLWEEFNGDGAHAYEAARLLLHQVLPFWPAGSGEIAGFPGLTSMLYAYPASWFIRLFGEHEVSARLPYLLFLVPLHAVLVALIGHGRAGAVPSAVRAWLWLALTNFTMVVAFSTTYNPYLADIALPATQDTLAVLMFLGYAQAGLERSWGWAVLFAVLTLLSLPTGLVFLGFWILGLGLVWGTPRPFGQIVPAIGVLGGGFLGLLLVPSVLNTLGLPAPGQEYGAGQLAMRFAFLQFLDVKRLLYVLVPAGLLPVAALFFWRRLDATARVFAFVTVAYFLFVYVQAYAPLHYYLPAILFLLVPFWRAVPESGSTRRTLLRSSTAGALVGLWLVLPAHAGPVIAARPVGEAVDVRVPGYDRMDPAVFRASTLLGEVIAVGWVPEVPESLFATSPLVTNFYAHRPVAEGAPRNYVLQPTGQPAPDGAVLVASDGEFSVFARDEDLWNAHRTIQRPTPAGAPLFATSRGLLFRTEEVPDGFAMVDVAAVLRRLGFDVDAIARRLGLGS